MIMILSLLEGRTDKLVIKRIYRQIPLDLLKRNLCTVYLRFKKLYGKKYTMKAFNHAEMEDDESDESEEE